MNNSKYNGSQVEALLDKINSLPTPTSSDNGKVLGVSGGSYSLITPVTVYSGSTTPSAAQGVNGDVYLQT